MKILYIISVNGEGIGGHYYSLKSTVNLIQQQNQCLVINIGQTKSPILSSMNVPVHNLIYKKGILSFLPILKQLKKLITEENPDIFHAFDKQSLFFGMLMSKNFKKPLIVTRCGGSNPILYPNVENLIVFSIENKQFFESKKIAKNIFFIPHRVFRPEQDSERINKIRAQLRSGSKIFLRISRISDLHKKSIIQSQNLIKKLNSDNVNAQLVIIGIIQNNEVYQDILVNSNENILIFTGDKYTENASALIDVAEFIIGTGRGFMEASSLKKIMLCPEQNSSIPLLITPENFDQAFSMNFSGRVLISNYDEDENYRRILDVISDETSQSALKNFSADVSKKYFEIESQREILQNIYKSLRYTNFIRSFDIIIQAILTLKRNLALERAETQPMVCEHNCEVKEI